MKNIIGVDEVGRGSLAGPVVACAVSFHKGYNPLHLKDSKKTSAKKRELIFSEVENSSFVEWGVGVVSEKIVDQINILEATKLAMKRSLEKIDYRNSHIIVDGNFSLQGFPDQESLLRADEKVAQCSLASIIAKVTRDRIMQSFHDRFPQYGFYHHKGYGTNAHRVALNLHGPCLIHRKSFRLLTAKNK